MAVQKVNIITRLTETIGALVPIWKETREYMIMYFVNTS